VTGIEIIEWAVRKCKEEKLPPSDNAIVRMIRYHLIDVNDVLKRHVTGTSSQTTENGLRDVGTVTRANRSAEGSVATGVPEMDAIEAAALVETKERKELWRKFRGLGGTHD
jgi:hypothetical protein